MKGNQSQDSRLGIIALIKRLHFYIGLFVGPFIFVAALTGTLYVVSPQIEQQLYQHALTTTSQGEAHSLQQQIEVARQSLQRPLKLTAVRPATGEGFTTRVMFADPDYSLQRLTVFVDPVTLAVQDTLPTYGTSGILPFMTTLDFLHRGLLLGETGRIYSELAASWMWLAALGGLLLWYRSKRPAKSNSRNAYLKAKQRHQKAGLIILVGLVFFSATGLTWSKWAGGNIAEWRKSIGWVTPSVNRALPVLAGSDQNAEPKQVDQLFDPVLALARSAGIEAKKIELTPSYEASRAWVVSEIDRSWPTQVDSVSIDPQSMTVTSRANFSDYPLIAKLIRWGIDAHMGVLFGVPNQIVLAAFGLTLCFMIVMGYIMWWKRRPAASSEKETISYIWSHLAPLSKLLTVLVAVGLGLALPVLGCSLLLFMLVDVLRWKMMAQRNLVTE